MTMAHAARSHGAMPMDTALDTGWEMASGDGLEIRTRADGLRFVPAKVPGTAASTLRDHDLWQMGDGISFDASHHLFRCEFDAAPAGPDEEAVLRIGGIATLAEVWLNGQSILKSQSMFAAHEVNVSELIGGRNQLEIVCYPLADALRERRGRRPTARWRTRVAGQQQLRWFRTTLLGRAPGFSPEPEPVGPWRPVSFVRRPIAIEKWSRQIAIHDSMGTIAIELRLRPLDGGCRPVSGSVVSEGIRAGFDWEERGDQYVGQTILRIPNPARWWPHTHGRAALYPLRVELELASGERMSFEDVPAGFRTIDPGPEPGGDAGLSLRINGKPIFCRGVVWTPPDVISLSSEPHMIRERLRLLRDAGCNMIRLAGTTIYESETFHRLCDELGLLVWQDMMFANMDYPFEDAEFCDLAQAEAESELSRLARHASTAVICGNSEVEQQAAMLGLDPAIGRGSFFGDQLPRLAARCCPGVPYLPSSPCGGDLPFHTRSGIAHYFGVGAYRRPLEDTRRAEVRFASECLAFSNVPEDQAMAAKGVPRDSGADWDFADVRDHYLQLLYAVDPLALRNTDPAHYWDLSRIVSGEVMAEVFGEWRRPASVCHGGIVLWSADLEPGAGWGVLDSEGSPKPAYWFLKRALAPYTVWTTDEGLNGADIHVANDAPEPLAACLRVALYRFDGQKAAEAHHEIAIPASSALTLSAEEILGRFTDAAYAYRFGPAGHDLIVVSLHRTLGDIPFAQSFRFPAGRDTQRPPISELGIAAVAQPLGDGTVAILVRSKRFAWGVHVSAPGFRPDDAYFGMEPGGERHVLLTPVKAERIDPRPIVTAINGEGHVPAALGRSA
jgi:beta-mannosidase